jgi:hypothetical protein
MIGFEDPKPGEGSIVHNELAGKKLREVVNIICDGGTEKELRVCAPLEFKHKGLVIVKLMLWHNAQYFRKSEKLELDVLGDLVVREVHEAYCGITVYVNMKGVECAWYE